MSPDNPKSASALLDASGPGMMIGPQVQLRVAAPRLPRNAGQEAADGVFQNLLTSANQELAKLMRDVRRARHGGRPWNSDGWRSSELLMRAVRCAAKHYILQAELRNLALKDELTGLHNRRGFFALAERQLKLGHRTGRGLLLFFIDVDGLKQINDSLGHYEGDRVLKRTANTLKETFRDSDIVARLGGDEFAVLAIEASGHCEATILHRLQRYVCASNRSEPAAMSLSVGVARFDRGKPASITELMVQADRAMYEQKSARRKSSSLPHT